MFLFRLINTHAMYMTSAMINPTSIHVASSAIRDRVDADSTFATCELVVDSLVDEDVPVVYGDSMVNEGVIRAIASVIAGDTSPFVVCVLVGDGDPAFPPELFCAWYVTIGPFATIGPLAMIPPEPPDPPPPFDPPPVVFDSVGVVVHTELLITYE